MEVRGDLCKMMFEFYPLKYQGFQVKSKRGSLTIYTILKKALYGTMQAALLFYKKLVRDLEEYGFLVNSYDVFVANKVVKNSQLISIWYVDEKYQIKKHYP